MEGSERQRRVIQMADRDCENCKHYKILDCSGLISCGCEKWNCEFESKESADESTEKMADEQAETGDM